MVDLVRPAATELVDCMTAPKEMDVVRRAYELWQQAGEPRGKDEEFYHQAKSELQEALDKEHGKGPSSSN
jgi:hypothetical protein